MTKKKAALGRGLGALLADPTEVNARYADHKPEEAKVGSVALIEIDDIETNPFQPRTRFDQLALEELAESIKLLGVIQPITVRKKDDASGYQLISGERRFRASQLAGLEKIPAYIRLANDQAMLEMAIVENVQREDLDAIEVALSYQRLIDECNLTQEQMAERVGKKRATVTNYLRLLKLPEEIQAALVRKQISMGHARALAGSVDKKVQIEILKKIILEDLSVRKTEVLVSQGYTGAGSKHKKDNPIEISSRTLKSAEKIGQTLNTKIALKSSAKGNGKIEIAFKNLDDLDRILENLSKK